MPKRTNLPPKTPPPISRRSSYRYYCPPLTRRLAPALHPPSPTPACAHTTRFFYLFFFPSPDFPFPWWIADEHVSPCSFPFLCFRSRSLRADFFQLIPFFLNPATESLFPFFSSRAAGASGHLSRISLSSLFFCACTIQRLEFLRGFLSAPTSVDEKSKTNPLPSCAVLPLCGFHFSPVFYLILPLPSPQAEIPRFYHIFSVRFRQKNFFFC